MFAAEDSKLDVISESRVVQLFAQISSPPGPNVPRAFLMQRGTDRHPTREAGIIANDKGAVAVSLHRAGGVLLRRLLQPEERWEFYTIYDGHAFEIEDN